MDGKFRLFGKISIIDILIVLLGVLFIYIAVQFSAPEVVSAAYGNNKITYTVEISEVPSGFEKNVIVGETLYDTLKGYEIGTVTDVYTKPYREEVDNLDDDMISLAPVEGMEYVYVVVEANADVTEKATLIGQYEVMVGKEVFVGTRSFAGSGYIVDLQKEAL